MFWPQPPPFAALKSHTVVLTYHDVVSARGKDSVWFDCTARELETQLDRLRAWGARFASVQDLFDSLSKGRQLPPGTVVVTFADNYAGFWKYARPILERRKIPACLFVHTGFVGAKVGRPKMDWNQLKILARDPLFTVASQTVTHPEDLRKLSSGQLAGEMADSKRALESRLGLPVRYVAYPNGKFGPREEFAAKAAGYAMAFSEETFPAERSPNLFSVNRYVHTKWRAAWKDLHRSAQKR